MPHGDDGPKVSEYEATQLRTLIESHPDGLLVVGPDDRITFANPAAETLLDRPAAQLVGQPFGLPATSESVTVDLAGAGGTPRVAEIRAVPVEWRGLSARLIVLHDTTERQARDAEAAQFMERRRNEFLAMLAHELRNPLAPVRNALYLMQRHPDDATSVAWARDVIDRQVRQLVQLVDGLLEVTRVTRGMVQLHKEPVDIGALAARVVETVQPLMEDRRHAVAVERPAKPVMAEADPLRLEQVLTNLLDNAAKYTPAGGRIVISVGRKNGDAVVRVQDDGIGIASDVLPRVFDLFEQADRTLDRSPGGLGLGLTLVKKLMEMHGGGATARSDGLGRGSTFTVRLPALPE